MNLNGNPLQQRTKNEEAMITGIPCDCSVGRKQRRNGDSIICFTKKENKNTHLFASVYLDHL